MSIKDELQQIYDERGKLTPVIVVDAARAEGHPLHDRFDWDNDTAAESWRREQARQLIRSVRIVYKQADEHNGAQTIRAFHSVRSDDGYAYRSTDEVLADPFTTKLLLAEMRREWMAMKRRYEHFAEFVEMVRADTDVA